MYEDSMYSPIQQHLPSQYTTLYHVTTRYRADLIAAKGIDPTRSKGKRKVSWFVGLPKLAWAIAHVSLRHKTPIENIVVIAVHVRIDDMKKTAWRDVLTCDQVVHPDPRRFTSARKCLTQIKNFY
jgi:hypothetical protein